ncbi:hypothetical protein [Streptomyces sp. NPDC005322]|uniref:hypothetical protein n=1 Tax=Streptomyces sp. NPDC005322 TaxID=3157032 RepID=UPI0033BE5E71
MSRPAQRHASGPGGRTAWGGTLPLEILLAKWPPHQSEPTDYWLTSLPADSALCRLVD